MSFTFATVAEGPTDHAVLQNILMGLFKEYGVESGDINAVQPLLDETGKQQPDSPGGWKQVLHWLEQEEFHAAFQFNDFVIVQLDTGVCEEKGYNVPKTINGIAHSPEDLVNLVKVKLRNIIGNNATVYPEGFHYAIAVHDIECWLLPLWGKPQEVSNINTCKQRVDNGLAQAKLAGLRKDDVRTYVSASSEFRKRSRLLEAAKSQKSLQLFCDSLVSIKIEKTDKE
jgi:hypothetical protein